MAIEREIVTDEECAALDEWLFKTPAELERREIRSKQAERDVSRVEARIMLASKESSVDKRKAEYMVSDEWAMATLIEANATASFNRLKHEIAITRSKIELYRSLKASDRARLEAERFRPRHRDPDQGYPR